MKNQRVLIDPLYRDPIDPLSTTDTIYIKEIEIEREEKKEISKTQPHTSPQLSAGEPAVLSGAPVNFDFIFKKDKVLTISPEVILKPLEGNPDMKAEIKEIFQYWQERMNHPNARCDAKRERLINAMLKIGYSMQNLKDAIDGCARSTWHMGENDRGKVYDDISLILRDASHVDSFMKCNVREEKPHVPLTRAQQSVEDGLNFFRSLNYVN